MPRTPLQPTRTLAKVLKARRLEAGLTHREVEARTTEMGERIPFATLARVEDGVQEVGFRRLHALMKLYRLPFEVLPDLMEMEQLAAALPEERDPEALYKSGLAHWHRGEYGVGLAHLFALRVLAPDSAEGRLQRQKGMLSFAIMASRLGRTKLAHRTVEQLLLEPPDPSLLVHTLIQAAVCWTGLGSHDAALGLLARAEEVRGADVRLGALIAHERARVFLLRGEVDRAEESIAAAIAGYRKSKDEANRVAAMRVRFEIDMRRGQFAKALETARKAHAAASERNLVPQAARRRLDMGRACLALDRVDEAHAIFTETLRQAIDLADDELRFFAHYGLYKVSERRGNADQAAFELHAARHYVRYVHDGSAESQEIRLADAGMQQKAPGAKKGPRRRRRPA